MSKPNGKTDALLSRTGLALTSLVALAVTALPVEQASAQSVLVKFDAKKLELQKKRDSAVGDIAVDGTTTIKSVRTKAPRDEEGSQTTTQQIVVGKSDRDENATGSGEAGTTRQVIVEPKPKKIVVTEPTVKKAKKIVVAKAEEPKTEVIADAAPEVEQAPVAEEPATEAPAAPQSEFKVGQIVTAGDGLSYVIVKIDETGYSVLPLSAFVEEPVYKPVYKKKRKKRYSGYGYSSYRSYGGYSSCH
jgi:hypothetical protein